MKEYTQEPQKNIWSLRLRCWCPTASLNIDHSAEAVLVNKCNLMHELPLRIPTSGEGTEKRDNEVGPRRRSCGGSKEDIFIFLSTPFHFHSFISSSSSLSLLASDNTCFSMTQPAPCLSVLLWETRRWRCGRRQMVKKRAWDGDVRRWRSEFPY